VQPFLTRLKRRSALIRAIRAYFDEMGFIEVDTSVTIRAPAPELHIEAPRVALNVQGQTQTRYLQTSPELAMKRLLALGAEKIYQIAPVFRDGDYGDHHRPEFRLLEWYRRDENWTTLLSDCETLFRRLATEMTGSETLSYQGSLIDLSPPFARISVEEAFLRHAGFSILDALESSKLRKELDSLGIDHAPSDGWDDLFHRVFLTLVEPKLLESPNPLFLTHYPAPLGSLARLSPEDPRVAERVELYVGGMELANGFGELTSSTEQRTRFEEARKKRLAMGSSDYPFDESFLECLDSLPPCAGIALGIDRLLMLALDLPTIGDSACLPWDES